MNLCGLCLHATGIIISWRSSGIILVDVIWSCLGAPTYAPEFWKSTPRSCAKPQSLELLVIAMHLLTCTPLFFNSPTWCVLGQIWPYGCTKYRVLVYLVLLKAGSLIPMNLITLISKTYISLCTTYSSWYLKSYQPFWLYTYVWLHMTLVLK